MMKEFKTLNWLKANCKKSGLRIAILTVLSVLAAIAGLLRAFYYREVINSIKPIAETGYYGDILKAISVFVGIIVFAIILSFLLDCLQGLATTDMVNYIRIRTMSAIYKKDYKKISAYHSGDLMTRMFSDTKLVAGNIISIVPILFNLVVKLIGAFIFMYILSKEFALYLLAAGIVFAFAAMLLRKKMKALHKALQEAEGKLYSEFQEQTHGILLIKAFLAGKRMKDKADGEQKNYRKTFLRQRLFSAFVSMGYMFAYNLLLISVFVYSVYGIIKGHMSYGDLVAMIQLANMVQSSIGEISTIFPRVYTTLASAERIIEIENLPDEINNGCDISDLDEISFNDVSFTYGRDDIFTNMNFTINKGEVIAVQGASGIGKSTMILMLLGIYNPTSGNILIKNGEKEVGVSAGTRALFSYIPQGRTLFSGSIKDNLLMGKANATEEEISVAIKTACIDEFISTLPEGLDTKIGEGGKGLSEGQMQRIAIARALLSNSEVLLFDEATSALDEPTERKVIENLKALNKTSLIITHRKSPLSICTKSYIIKDSVLEEI